MDKWYCRCNARNALRVLLKGAIVFISGVALIYSTCDPIGFPLMTTLWMCFTFACTIVEATLTCAETCEVYSTV